MPDYMMDGEETDKNVVMFSRAMRLLYDTTLIDAELAKWRGEAIRAIDKLIVAHGEKSLSARLDAKS